MRKLFRIAIFALLTVGSSAVLAEIKIVTLAVSGMT